MFQVWQIRQQNNAFSDVERAGNLFALLVVGFAFLFYFILKRYTKLPNIQQPVS